MPFAFLSLLQAALRKATVAEIQILSQEIIYTFHCVLGYRRLYLGQAAVDEQLDSGDVTAVIGCEKHDGFGDFIRRAEPTERRHGGNHFLRCSPASDEANSPFKPGVSIKPGLIAFTRMRRSLRSVVQVRANERTAAFVAL